MALIHAIVLPLHTFNKNKYIMSIFSVSVQVITTTLAVVVTASILLFVIKTIIAALKD